MNEQTARPANAVAHFDISGPDDAGLHRFYGDLLDWQIDRKGPGYALVRTPGGLGGAIVETEQAGVALGVVVPDLEQAVRRAAELGGAVAMPPTDNGWVVKAQVKDPAGNVLTLIQA
ncbi:VOC family protein [Streptosporangium sp. NPDC049644]|uniref:VOC family protein n=1 Tax=Streptosporangium sp. NPDC049644 TaxID=3155507 RepID=UPI00344713C9